MSDTIFSTFSGLTNAFGWTIIHAVWQITVVALGLKLLLLLTSRYSSTIRYWLSMFALFVVAIWSIQTFQVVFDQVSFSDNLTSSTEVITSQEVLIQKGQLDNTIFCRPFEKLGEYRQVVESFLPLITCIWFLGLVFFASRIGIGWWRLKRYAYNGIQKMPEVWQTRVDQLIMSLGIQRRITVRLSTLVSVPITYQIFRPVILLPFSLYTGLTDEQIEVLLLHELAHIRRQDYLFNLLQSVVEVVFFYHPLLWWISKNVRQEREHCCDDLVMKLRHQPMLYAQTLTQIQIQHYSFKTTLAMSANGNKGVFTQRIYRLFTQREPYARVRNYAAILVLLLIGGLTMAFYPISNSNPAISNGIEEQKVVLDTIPQEKKLKNQAEAELHEENVWIQKSKKEALHQQEQELKELQTRLAEKAKALKEKAKSREHSAEQKEELLRQERELAELKRRLAEKAQVLKEKNREANEWKWEQKELRQQEKELHELILKLEAKTKLLKEKGRNVDAMNEAEQKVFKQQQLELKELKLHLAEKKAVLHEKLKAQKEQNHFIFKSEDGAVIELKPQKEEGENIFYLKEKGEDGKIKKRKVYKIDTDKGDKVNLSVKDNEYFTLDLHESKKPLIVLDGEIVTKYKIDKSGKLIMDIPMEQVQTVNVRKGTKALERYGDKAYDGVVEITTQLNGKAQKYDEKDNDGLQVEATKHEIKVKGKEDGILPLFVVDGKILENGKEKLAKISPDEISTINVIKGQAAISLYGDKGKDGVVEINTKKKQKAAKKKRKYKKEKQALKSKQKQEKSIKKELKEKMTAPVIPMKNELEKQPSFLEVFPNPANDFTNIQLNLAKKGMVKVDIYNGQGQLIKTLVNQSLVEGQHQFQWDSSQQPTGTYIVHFNLDGELLSKQLSVVK